MPLCMSIKFRKMAIHIMFVIMCLIIHHYSVLLLSLLERWNKYGRRPRVRSVDISPLNIRKKREWKMANNKQAFDATKSFKCLWKSSEWNGFGIQFHRRKNIGFSFWNGTKFISFRIRKLSELFKYKIRHLN